MLVSIFKCMRSFETYLSKITSTAPAEIQIRHRISMETITSSISSGSHYAPINLKKLLQDIQGSIKSSEDIQNFLMQLIRKKSDLRIMYHLEFFFTRILRNDSNQNDNNRKFTSYCAEARNRLEKYFCEHFEKLLGM